MQPQIENDNENILVDATLEQNNKLDELNDSNEAQLQGIIQTNEQLEELNSGVDLLVEKLSEEKEIPSTKFSFEVDGAEIQTIEGPKGDPGKDGVSPDKNEIVKDVITLVLPKIPKAEDILKMIPIPKDGRDGVNGIGEKGERGLQGFPGVGRVGPRGPAGTTPVFTFSQEVRNTVAGTNSASTVTVGGTQTLTNKRVTQRNQDVNAPGATTQTITSDSTDIYTLRGLNGNTTFAAPSGTPTQGQKLMIRIKDDSTPRTLTWNAIFRAIGVTLPTTTVASKTHYIGCVYNSTDTKWDVLAVGVEA